MRSARSPGFLRPAKTILVPGIYFFGFSRYSKSVSSFHVIPNGQKMKIPTNNLSARIGSNKNRSYLSLCWHLCMNTQLLVRFYVQIIRKDLDQPCACHQLQRYGIERIVERMPFFLFLHLQLVHPFYVKLKFMWLCNKNYGFFFN